MTITNLPSSILVTKSATPTSLPEPGGNATFDVTVKNTSAVDSVTITSLSDNVYGNLDGKGSCDVPQTLAPGASYSCSFTGAVSGNAGSSHTDVVTASGTDDDGNPVSDDDDATVTITDLASSILVTKTADPTSLPEPGGNASFSVTVKNTSASDSVTITSLSDDVYGNLDGKGTCDVPFTLAPGASYDCAFTGAVSAATPAARTPTSSPPPAPTTTATRSRITTTRSLRSRTRELDRGDEDGDADLAARAWRQRDVRRHGQEHVGGRLGHDLEPERRRLRQPRREGQL